MKRRVLIQILLTALFVACSDDTGPAADAGADASGADVPFRPRPDAGFDDGGNPVDLGPGDFGLADTGPADAGGADQGFSRDAQVVDPLYDECGTFSATVDIPIRVIDSANVARDPQITGVMIPFARATGVVSLNGLIVVDAQDNRLPAQLETLSRWGAHVDDCTAPIRFAYAHIRAAPSPGQSVTWSLRNDAAAGPEPTPLSVSESEYQWVVDTGAARFTIRRDQFHGLSKVELLDGTNATTISEIVGPRGSEGFLLEHGGMKASANLHPYYLELERAGPQLVTIAARGYYAAPGGGRDLAYTVRLYFYAGSSVVRVDHTYYHGDVEDFTASGAVNTTTIDRAFMRIPLAFSPTSVSARAVDTVHTGDVGQAMRIEQQKRSPSENPIRFDLTQNGQSVESGGSATRPFIAAGGAEGYVLASIARMAERDPQGLRFNPGAPALEIDFTSSPMQVGGARGIWSIATIDFGAAGADLAARADNAQLLAERPQLGAASVDHLNSTQTVGPYATNTTQFPRYFSLLSDFHDNTNAYLRSTRITGLQVWPDMPRSSCEITGACGTEQSEFFDNGDNNYWNWSKPGFDEFLRTGDNRFVYDFSRGEAISYVETIAFRTYHDRIDDSDLTGMAPCYGTAFGYTNEYIEGLKSRRDACPADYSYSKTLKMAYLVTADRRFVDFFEEAGLSTIAHFGFPEPSMTPEEYFELSFFRFAEQRLENLMNGVEFAHEPMVQTDLLAALSTYVDRMLDRVLLNGHSCSLQGSGAFSAADFGNCNSDQGWMMATSIEFARRASRFLDHGGLRTWLLQHGTVAAERHTLIGSNGLPDYSNLDGWFTLYQCQLDANGVDDNACIHETDVENDGHFYLGDLTAFLNVFGLILSTDASDPARICEWLPAAYETHVNRLDNIDLNESVWGKPTGLAFGMAAEAVGAMQMNCP